MFCAEIDERTSPSNSFHSFNFLIYKDITFPLITKFKSNRSLSYLSDCNSNTESKMWPYRLINDINKLVLNLYFRFQIFILKHDKSLRTSLIIIIKGIIMIEMHKNVVRC